MTMKKDNRVGALMCHQLLSAKLTDKEREFVMSINQNILLHPMKFSMSSKQSDWFRSLYNKYYPEIPQ
jgi:hypothetical protein